MKRSRALASVSRDIVETSKEKDAYGNLHYPLVIALFGTPNTLHERPLLLINTLQTNKALNKFINQFDGLWPLLTDIVLEKKMGTYVSEIYPFLAVQQYREKKRTWEENEIGTKPEVLPDFIGGRKDEKQNTPVYVYYADHRSKKPVDPIYYVVYYDEVTRLFMDLLAVMDTMLSFASQYIKMTNKFSVASFVDCFLIAVSDQPRVSYDIDVLREAIMTTAEKVTKQEIELEDNDPDMYCYEIAACQKAKKLCAELIKRVIEEGEIPDAPVLMKLDKNTAQQYRTLLYDKEQGLLKNPKAQKDFYVRVVASLGDDTGYGQALKCVVCLSETHLVDPIHSVALCHENCRAHYLK